MIGTHPERAAISNDNIGCQALISGYIWVQFQEHLFVECVNSFNVKAGGF